MALDRLVQAFGAEIETVASVDVGMMWDRMLGEFLQEWVRVERQRLPPIEVENEMRSFLEALSDKPEADLARKSATVAYNRGRAAEIKTAAEAKLVEWVVRSEILDQATCSECTRLDGIIVAVDGPSFETFMPPAYCLGGDRCRGFYVVIPGEMAA